MLLLRFLPALRAWAPVSDDTPEAPKYELIMLGKADVYLRADEGQRRGLWRGEISVPPDADLKE